jgi:hypothetical protein
MMNIRSRHNRVVVHQGCCEVIFARMSTLFNNNEWKAATVMAWSAIEALKKSRRLAPPSFKATSQVVHSRP